MKTLMILTAFLLCGTGIHAQTDCQAYMPIQEGSKWEISSYSKKDKLTSRVEHELIEKVINGNEILFILKSIAFDEKGEEIFSNTSESKCINGSFKIDMSAKIDPILLESYKDMDMHIDASDYTMPKHDEPVGTNLEDAYVKITIETPILLAMTINISERKIEKKEKMTCPAGTFDCIQLSQKVALKMGINIEAYSKEWYAEDIGMVRSESYTKNGKLTGYSLLTKLN